jgi:hypothetical protein
MVEGQRYDLHVKWLEEAAVRKRELMKKGLIVADDGQAFGWGEEGSHLGHSEIFCRHTSEPECVQAVQDWLRLTAQKALDGCIAVPAGSPGAALPIDYLGPHVSNYNKWYGKLKKAFDPAGVGELTGFSYVGSDTSAAHTSLYQKQEGKNSNP